MKGRNDAWRPERTGGAPGNTNHRVDASWRLVIPPHCNPTVRQIPGVLSASGFTNIHPNIRCAENKQNVCTYRFQTGEVWGGEGVMQGEEMLFRCSQEAYRWKRWWVHQHLLHICFSPFETNFKTAKYPFHQAQKIRGVRRRNALSHSTNVSYSCSISCSFIIWVGCVGGVACWQMLCLVQFSMLEHESLRPVETWLSWLQSGNLNKML